MSGRGKGGKGLGKGGAKRHRKVLRDNIQGITKPAIRRLARRGGVKRISGLIYEETRGVLKVFLENVIRDSVTYTEHARRKTVTAMDVVYALKRQGRTLYGRRDQMRAEGLDPEMMHLWMMLQMRIGCLKLDFYALQRSFAAAVMPIQAAMWKSAGEWTLDEALRAAAAPRPSDDEDARFDNDYFAPCNTKATQDVREVVFAGPGTRGAVAAAYSAQLALRFDDARRCLFVDAYEARPEPVAEGAVPTLRAVLRGEKAAELDAPVPPRDGKPFTVQQNARSCSGPTAATSSRAAATRRVKLASVVGVALRAPAGTRRDAVLALEFDAAPSDFAVRRVASHQRVDNERRAVDDWTPGGASAASRLATASRRVARRLRRCRRPRRRGAVPPAAEGTLQFLAASAAVAAGATAGDVADRRYPPPSSPRSLCLKAGILRGHVVLDEALGRDQVLNEGGCCSCGNDLVCTVGDAMDQPDYGGMDYGNGGEEAPVQCEDCCGNYLTGMCEGQMRFDSGKFHNHCGRCPDFGVCIHDYRNAHCELCGTHWFQGNSGFPTTTKRRRTSSSATIRTARGGPLDLDADAVDDDGPASPSFARAPRSARDAAHRARPPAAAAAA
ncbi:hypothetical protein JL722_13026 [Aureococcus anophagefferens]|nr:hypothetical protein JL722_13026 [Aureococcus anophagefferens]